MKRCGSWAFLIAGVILWMNSYDNLQGERESDFTRQIDSAYQVRKKAVYRVEVPFNGSIRTYTGTEMEQNGTTFTFKDSVSEQSVTVQNAILTHLRDSLNQRRK